MIVCRRGLVVSSEADRVASQQLHLFHLIDLYSIDHVSGVALFQEAQSNLRSNMNRNLDRRLVAAVVRIADLETSGVEQIAGWEASGKKRRVDCVYYDQ